MHDSRWTCIHPCIQSTNTTPTLHRVSIGTPRAESPLPKQAEAPTVPRARYTAARALPISHCKPALIGSAKYRKHGTTLRLHEALKLSEVLEGSQMSGDLVEHQTSSVMDR
jgi:hypothetical protein